MSRAVSVTKRSHFCAIVKSQKAKILLFLLLISYCENPNHPQQCIVILRWRDTTRQRTILYIHRLTRYVQINYCLPNQKPRRTVLSSNNSGRTQETYLPWYTYSYCLLYYYVFVIVVLYIFCTC